MHKRFFLILISVLSTTHLFTANAQYAQNHSSSEIFHEIQKLQKTARVLYIAAHPDDENTRLISYLVNDRKVETAYLSLTRGDGGQNVIGHELREELGLIRTQELLAARRVDGGQQFFTRANDFGYSKTPAETFNIWDREEVLSDIVWVIRNFQPDIIITRFNETPKITHGHHTASAILAHEAFKAAADKNKFDSQLKYVNPWQSKKLFWNTSSWFFRGNENFDPSKYLEIEVGGYNAALGMSYTEIAAKSRSQHKSQAFGTSGTRGSQKELFEQWEGERVENDLFDGIETGWKAYKNGDQISKILDSIVRDFDVAKPEKSIPQLLVLREEFLKLPSGAVKKAKLNATEKLILNALGFYSSVSSANYYASPGDSLTVDFEFTNRAGLSVSLDKLVGEGVAFKKEQIASLSQNESYTLQTQVVVNRELSYSTPYWLRSEGSVGMYIVNDQQLIGKAENSPAIEFQLDITIANTSFSVIIPLTHKSNSRTDGEIIEPFYISPSLSINFLEEVMIFTKPNQEKVIDIEISSFKDNVSGEFVIDLPQGWKIDSNESFKFKDLQKGEVHKISAKVISGKDFGVYQLKGKIIDQSENELKEHVSEIAYDHIPNQVIISEASAKLMFADVKTSDRVIGYISGAGDKIPEALESMGYSVENIDLNNSSVNDLVKFPAIVAGIRAYNTNTDLQNQYTKLLDYMAAGGTYIVQYNTTYSLPDKDFFPYGLKLSRDRITDETAELKLLESDHTIFNYPNKINASDFKNWVQERGLYFPSEWETNYTPLLEGHDPDESETQGALLVSDYGKGKLIYTGLSFFRELPAGVPGAYRLFSNIVSN